MAVADEKLDELNKIKEDLFALYPNAIKITFVAEGDKITVKPEEKYAVPVEPSEEE